VAVIDSQDRRSIYPIWLRFFTFFAAIAAALILLGPSFSFSNSDPSLPWNEQARILSAGKTSEAKPSADQPQLTRVLRYKAQAEQDGSPCGTVNVLIYPDGIVRGVWNGEYTKPGNVNYLIMAASFDGNIDPSRPFIKDGFQDPSKLYFITAGAFTLVETQLSTGQSRGINGFLYVRGWLDPNYTALGDLTITEDKKSFETFDWAAQPAN
jgi:hypothetical protein